MKRIRRAQRWVYSLVLALAMSVSFAAICAYAGGKDQTEKYLLNEDGSQTRLSDAEYARLKENGALQSEIDEWNPEIEEISSTGFPKAIPDYSGVFEVYHNYFNYYPYSLTGNSEMSGYFTGRKLYLEYRTNKAKTWKRSGYMQRNLVQTLSNQSYMIDGLKPNTTYKTRIRYENDDGTLGRPLNTTTITTGKNKAPSVKSVSVQGYSIKHRKVRHYLYGVYMYTEKFYTYKVRVTVKLKKRPGTKGVFLRVTDGTWDSGFVWINGNKKSYTKKFTPYPNYSVKNPRHRMRFSVSIRSGQNKTWYGVSPVKSVTRKMS